jgi:hypothetical protein
MGCAGGRVDVAVSRRLSRCEVLVLPQLASHVSARGVFGTTVVDERKMRMVIIAFINNLFGFEFLWTVPKKRTTEKQLLS